MVGARIKIMWEEQLVDPPNDYRTPVNVPDYRWKTLPTKGSKSNTHTVLFNSCVRL